MAASKANHCCSICGKCFSRKYILTDHVNAHFGFKPYQCGFCQTAFTRKHDLSMHRKQHESGPRFQCITTTVDSTVEGCGKVFDRKTGLDRHLRRKGASSCKRLGKKDSDIIMRSLLNDPLSMKLSRREIVVYWGNKSCTSLTAWSLVVTCAVLKLQLKSSATTEKGLRQAHSNIIQVALTAMGIRDWALLYSCVSLLALIDCYLHNSAGLRQHSKILLKFQDGTIYSSNCQNTDDTEPYYLDQSGSEVSRPNPEIMIDMINAFLTGKRYSTRKFFNILIPRRTWEEFSLPRYSIIRLSLPAPQMVKAEVCDSVEDLVSKVSLTSTSLSRHEPRQVLNAFHEVFFGGEFLSIDDDDDQDDPRSILVSNLCIISIVDEYDAFDNEIIRVEDQEFLENCHFARRPRRISIFFQVRDSDPVTIDKESQLCE